MQYRIITGSDYKDYIGVNTYRFRIRDGALKIDLKLTATGFAGTENVDWEGLDSMQIPPEYLPPGVTPEFRYGVRELGMNFDQSLGGLIFDGAENVDWEELREYKRP